MANGIVTADVTRNSQLEHLMQIHDDVASTLRCKPLPKEPGHQCLDIASGDVLTRPVAENRLEQQFTPSAPNQLWVTDITYISTDEGWLYLAGVKDVFTCEIVGYALGERMTQALTGQALWRAIQHKRPQPAGKRSPQSSPSRCSFLCLCC